MIVTFYSFKGGVGRSMALANVAEILAARGYQVIACDWDLEAPGLERSFTTTNAESIELAARPGLMDLLRAYKQTLGGGLTAAPNRETQVKVGEVWLTRPSTCAIPVSRTPRGGSVRLLTAGARPSDAYGKYADEVRDFDWKEFYDEWAGGAYIDFVRSDLSAGIGTSDGRSLPPAADITLVDSRTGVTEHGGVCTHHLADVVVLMSAANDSNFYGSLRMAESLTSPALKELRSGRGVLVLPVRTRIEQTSQVVELNEFRARFNAQFRRYLPGAFQSTATFLDDAEIPYIGLYSFAEVNLAREGATREPKLFKAYQVLADAIVECGVHAGLLRDAGTSIGAGSIDGRAVGPVRPISGTFEIRAAADSADLGAALAAELKRLGATIAAAANRAPMDVSPVPTLNGAMLLVGSATPEPWVRAHFDELLRQHASSSDFRILAVFAPGVDASVYPYLNRARTIVLGASEGSGRAARLANELSGPAPAVALEPAHLCPYPGPRAFEEGEARLFFGRNAELRDMLARADPTRPLLIAGPRGVGKTSLVQAAVFPSIRRGELFPHFFASPIVHCAVARKPFAALAAALVKGLASPQDAGAIERELRDDVGALAKRMTAGLGPGEFSVLSVDGLENLWSADVPPEESSQLARVLEHAIASQPSIFVVASIASDALQNIPHPFVEQLHETAVQVVLAPLNHLQLVEAISGPARLAGLAFDARLPDRIAAEIIETAAPMALFQGLLAALWQRRTGASITETVLRTVGGVGGPAIELANIRMMGLAEPRRRRAQRLLATLALNQRAGGRKLSRARATQVAGGKGTGEQLLDHLLHPPPLIDIQPSNDVTLAGRVLLERWEALRNWMEAERDRRRNRMLQAAAAVAAFVLIGLLAFVARERAIDARLTSETLALASLQRLQENPLEGLDLAIQAGTAAETDEARTAIEKALELRYPRVVLRHDAPVRSAAFSPDSAVVATGDDIGTVHVWDVRDGRIRLTLKHRGAVNAVRFSPDGRSLATASYDGTITMWNAATGSALWQSSPTPAQWIVTAEFRPDGGAVIAGGSNGGVWILTDADHREVLEGHTAAVTAASFSRDGRRILTTSVDGTAKIWSSANHQSPLITIRDAGPGAVSGAFASDSETVAIAGRGILLIHVPRDDNVVPSITARTDFDRVETGGADAGGESAVVFSADGRFIATRGDNGVRVRASPGSLVATVQSSGDWRGTRGEALDIEFHPTDPLLAVARQDGSTLLWSAQRLRQEGTLRAHERDVRTVKFSPDGTSIVTASADATAALWTVSAPETLPTNSAFRYLLETAANVVPRGAAEGGPSRGAEAR